MIVFSREIKTMSDIPNARVNDLDLYRGGVFSRGEQDFMKRVSRTYAKSGMPAWKSAFRISYCKMRHVVLVLRYIIEYRW
jgi:hypothetical protein